MTTADTLARILTLRVDLRDEKACAEISPEMANRYLRAHGWENLRTTDKFHVWRRGDDVEAVPVDPTFADYGRRMVETLRMVAEAEQRSSLAVWVDMMGQKETAA